MSSPIQDVRIVPDERPAQVVVISHSPLFYWWPVWAVGFLMAAVSFMQGALVAFVPAGTVAERKVSVPGHKGARDVLIALEGQPLPAEAESGDLMQPRMRMAVSNTPGIVWALTLCLVIVITHVQMRGVWSLVVILALVALIVVFAAVGIMDRIIGALQVIDVHINALGYLAISVFLFVIWLFMFFFFDRLNYMIFTRGRLRVRKAIGEGEKVFDMRGMMFKRHRDDMFRHWLLGFGTADLTVFTSGANAQQIEMPNVLGVGRKLNLINTMLQELEVTKGR
jgi:hypothetical protein